MRKSLLVAAIAATALPSLAQNAVGLMFNVSIGATSRGSMAARPGQLLFRTDSEDYRGLGNPQGTNATSNDINGMWFILQDQYGTSLEQYDVRFYGEDLTTPNPNFPNFAATQPVGTNELVHFGPFTSPANTTPSPIAWIITLTFASPLSLPNDQDVFTAIELQQSAAASGLTPPDWPNDGLSVQINLGIQPGANFTVFDLKGPGAIAGGATGNSYGLVHDVLNSAFSYGGARQGAVEWLTSNVNRGVLTAVTNQGTYTISNTAPGTASFFSGLHPDASSSPANGGRVDDVFYAFFGANAGEIVFYLADFSFNAPELPLSFFLPGSTGVQCLPFSMSTLGFTVSTGSGRDDFMLALSPTARNFVLGLNLAIQGVAFDAVAGVVKGGPCGMAHF